MNDDETYKIVHVTNAFIFYMTVMYRMYACKHCMRQLPAFHWAIVGIRSSFRSALGSSLLHQFFVFCNCFIAVSHGKFPFILADGFVLRVFDEEKKREITRFCYCLHNNA